MSRRAPAAVTSIVFGAPPRADLLPPEVGLQRQEARRRGGYITGIVLVALVVIAAIVGSAFYAGSAEADLAIAQAETEELLTERLSYSEVVEVQRSLARIEQERATVAESVVRWQELTAPYRAILQSNAEIESLAAVGNTPGAVPLGTTGPLRVSRVATIAVIVLTDGLPPVQSWVQQLESLDSVADVSIDGVSRTSDDRYATTLTINVSETALAGSLIDEEADS